MDQEDVQAPMITTAGGYSLLKRAYLHVIVFVFRTIVDYLTGKNEGHDQEIRVDTPWLGTGIVTCYVWLPAGHNPQKELPMILVFEGGGFVLGRPKDGRRNNRLMADKVGAVVISVDYAKAPQFPFPHALLQGFEVLKWSMSSEARKKGVFVDCSRIVIMGNSAGGNLTAALSLLISFSSGSCATFRQALPPKFHQVLQILLYPCLELHHSYRERLQRTTAHARAKSLPAWIATAMESSYLPPATSKTQIFVSPVLSDVKLLQTLGVCPAVVLTGAWDCLKEEGLDYATNLEKAGKSVRFEELPQAIHGFSHFFDSKDPSKMKAFEKCWEIILDSLSQALDRSSTLS